MVEITGGVISVEDGRKAPEEYTPARKVRVELRFDVAPGTAASDALTHVSNVADNEVARLLGTSSLSPAASTTRIIRDIPAGEPGSVIPAADVPAKRTRRTKEQIAADEAAAKAASSTDPLAGLVEEDTGTDPLAGLVEEAKPITDADLNAAVQEKAKSFKDIGALRGLIQKDAPEGFGAKTLADVPADQRQNFLDKLAALA